MPRVSVIIPTYNGAAYIKEAVDSVLAQSYQDFELVITDDGSTDNTREVLEPYLDQITYLHQENQGESVARNRGIEAARGEYLAFLDSDDLWLPTKLERQVAILDTHPEAVLAYCHSKTIDEAGERLEGRGGGIRGGGKLGVHEVFSELVMSNIVANVGAVMVRTSLLAQGAAFDPGIQLGEDWDLWLRLSVQGPFAFIPEPLACIRVRGDRRRLYIQASAEYVRQSEAILRRVFQMVPEDRPELRGLQPSALRALFLRSSTYNFELGNVNLGSQCITHAIQADPGFFSNATPFVRWVADEGFRIAKEAGRIGDGEAFVELVFGNLPPEGEGLRTYRSQALGQMYMAAAFTQFEQANRAGTLHFVMRAIHTYPPCIGNVGLVSIAAQALLGRKPWSRWSSSHHAAD